MSEAVSSRPGLSTPRPGALPETLNIADAAPVRRSGRWVLTVLVLVLVAQLLHGFATNPNFEWSVVRQYMAAPVILSGLVMSLLLTAVCMLLGTVLGIVIAAFRRSDIAVLQAIGSAYVWVFRGLPPLVQLIFWFNLGALMPRLGIGIPFGPTLASWQTNLVITAMVAAVLGLSLNEGAYMAEIIRAGLMSVDHGQHEAAQALGFGRAHTFRRIAMPQAMKFIVPPTGTQVINMVKATSLVSVIAMGDLLYAAQVVYHRTFQTIPLLVVACLWYLIVTSVLSVGQGLLERRYARGDKRRSRPAARRKPASMPMPDVTP
jgi:polar amino acid transport system permease protein